MYDIASIFNEAYVKVATMDKGSSGFRAAGMFPYDLAKFSEVDFFPETENLPPVVLDQETNENLGSYNAANAINEPADVSEIPVKSKEIKNKNQKHKNLNLAGIYENPVAETSSTVLPETQPIQESQNSKVIEFKEKLLSLSPLQRKNDRDQCKTKRHLSNTQLL